MRDSWHGRVFSDRWHFSEWCDGGWFFVNDYKCIFATGFACAVSTQLPDDPQKYEDNCNCPKSSTSDSCSIRVAAGGRRGRRGRTFRGRSRRGRTLGGRRGAGGVSGAGEKIIRT